MERHVKWRNKSFQMRHESERWVPEAIISLIEGNTSYRRSLTLSPEDSEKIKRGEIIFSTHAQAKAKACEMVKQSVLNEWGISDEKIQEEL